MRGRDNPQMHSKWHFTLLSQFSLISNIKSHTSPAANPRIAKLGDADIGGNLWHETPAPAAPGSMETSGSGQQWVAAIILVYETPGTGLGSLASWAGDGGACSWESDHQDDQDDDDADAWVWCWCIISNGPGAESSQHIYELFSAPACLAQFKC